MVQIRKSQVEAEIKYMNIEFSRCTKDQEI